MTKDKRGERRGGMYWINKQPYVSVTNVLRCIDKPALRYWFGREVYRAFVKDPGLSEREALAAPYKISSKAKDRGKTVHSVVEAYKKSKVVIKDIPEEFRGYTKAFYKWIGDHKDISFVDVEKTVFSKNYLYAGTLDVLAKQNGEHIIVDVKTSKKGAIYSEAELQVSAYMNALNEMDNGYKVKRGFILALSETGEYTYKESENNLSAFLATKVLWRFLNRNLCQKLGYPASSVGEYLRITNQTGESSAEEAVGESTGQKTSQ